MPAARSNRAVAKAAVPVARTPGRALFRKGMRLQASPSVGSQMLGQIGELAAPYEAASDPGACRLPSFTWSCCHWDGR